MRSLGSIYTPPEFAKYLAAWSIREATDTVLDLGIGEGVFVFAAYHRLLELGAGFESAQEQIHGVEIDSAAFENFQEACISSEFSFPNLQLGDFFKSRIAATDAIIGNPPYVRRREIIELENIRREVLKCNADVEENDLLRQTDLYVYFLLRSMPNLKMGGRLAVMVADSWLNVRYGRILKDYLNKHFVIEQLISLDRRVFASAQVKPVLLLATKVSETNPNHSVKFIRLRNGLPINVVNGPLDVPHEDVIVSSIKQEQLRVNRPWGIYFKAPKVYDLISEHDLTTPVANVAKTRIGIQTLAKDFFVLTAEEAERRQIEPDFLAAIAQSARYQNTPIIDNETPRPFFLFYCSLSKDKLEGTHALSYIVEGESRIIELRGTSETVKGYHNKDRIKRSGRPNWYDLRTSIVRRGRAPILVPRLIYDSFTVIWNRAGFVPGELFIEFIPNNPKLDIRSYLAILNSTLTEITIRLHAQVYGGGTYNLKPGQIKSVPIVNVNELTPKQIQTLSSAYDQFAADPTLHRCLLDEAVNEVLGFDGALSQLLDETLQDLRLISTSAKVSPNPE